MTEPFVPKEPGPYWWRHHNDNTQPRMCVVDVIDWDGHLMVRYPGNQFWDHLKRTCELGMFYPGPITPPQEEKE